jgi:hypothetical protein
MGDKVFERLKEVAMKEFGVTLTKVDYVEKSNMQPKRHSEEIKLSMIINNLRFNGATKEEIETEIEFRKNNLSVDNPKCFGYLNNELEDALANWNRF